MKNKPHITYEYGTIYKAGTFPNVSPLDIELEDKVFDNLWDYLLCENDKGNLDQVFKLCQKGKDRKYIRVQKFVGTIQTKDGTIIEILPKIYKTGGQQETDAQICREVFLKMLRALRTTKALKFKNASLETRKNFPILEVYISNYILAVEDICLRGLGREYNLIHSNNPFLKGKLLVSQHIRKNVADRTKFFVEYKVLNEDIPQNRILATTLNYLLRVSHSPSNLVRIHSLLDMLSHIPMSRNIKADLKKAKSGNRLLSYYNTAIEWSEQILEGNGFTTFAGKFVNQSLLFPAERLFEDYVAHLFKKYLTEYNVSSQHRKYFLIDRHNGSSRFRLRPDIYAEAVDEGGLVEFIILDTKWKAIDSTQPNKDYLIDMKDMYQLYAYGSKYGQHLTKERDTNHDIIPHLVLIYPYTEKFNEPLPDFEYESITKDYGLKLKIVPFNLTANAEEEVRKIIDSLSIMERGAEDVEAPDVPAIEEAEEPAKPKIKPIRRKDIQFTFRQPNVAENIAAAPQVVYNESLLIGCFKGNDHLKWIAESGYYNIRKGSRKGAVNNTAIVNRATRLLLYDKRDMGSYYYFELTGDILSADSEFMRQKDYPYKDKDKDKSREYFLYQLKGQLDTPKIDVKKLIERVKPTGWKPGVPIFLTFTGNVEELSEIE